MRQPDRVAWMLAAEQGGPEPQVDHSNLAGQAMLPSVRILSADAGSEKLAWRKSSTRSLEACATCGIAHTTTECNNPLEASWRSLQVQAAEAEEGPA